MVKCVCVAEGMHGRGWGLRSVCVAGETATAADGAHPTGMLSRYKQCIDNRTSHISFMRVYPPGSL